MVSELTSASLDCYRALRDAAAEAAFFQIYGNLFAFYLERQTRRRNGGAAGDDPRELSFVKEALASIDKGGYAEALARVAFLMAHKDEPLPLSRLQLAHDLIEEYRDLLPTYRTRRGAPYRRRAGDHRALRTGKGSRDAACAGRRSERPGSAANAVGTRARRPARATHPAFGRAESDARAYPRGARRRGAPANRVAARSSTDPGPCSGQDCGAARRAGEETAAGAA